MPAKRKSRMRGLIKVPRKRVSTSIKFKLNLTMLYTIALILIIAWLLGIISGYTMGNFIYILLVVAIIMILVRLIQGNKPPLA
jgi:hypothetical protein